MFLLWLLKKVYRAIKFYSCAYDIQNDYSIIVNCWLDLWLERFW